MGLQIHVEPKTPVLKVGRVKTLLALDDEKRSMAPSGDDQENAWRMGMVNYNGFNRSHVVAVNVPLVLPSKNSRLVSRIKGVVPLTLLAEQKPLIVTDGHAGAVVPAVGDATFQIDDIEVTKGNVKQYSFKITYNENTNETRYDYSKIQSLQQRLELRDAKGVKSLTHPNFLHPTSATALPSSLC